jgi:host factor-I protein
MAAQSTSALQDIVLKHFRDNNVEIMMFLVNGIRLLGQIRSFDNYTVQLVRGGNSQIVFKHAISAMSPAGSVQLANQNIES